MAYRIENGLTGNGRDNQTKAQETGIARKDVTTLFMDNLLRSMYRDWICHLFKYEGNLVDVFLS